MIGIGIFRSTDRGTLHNDIDCFSFFYFFVFVYLLVWSFVDG